VNSRSCHPRRATRVSVVIPTLNESGVIRDALAQFERLPGEWELIVADSGSDDGTREIVAATRGARLVDAPRGRGVGMNAGAAAAKGDILLFLHADTRLPHAAWTLVTAALRDPRVAATAFHLRFDRDGPRYRFLAGVSQARIPLQRTFFGDQAIATRRADFERVGGYGERLLMEDVDLSRKLRRVGRLRTLPATVTTSARRFERGGVARTLLFMLGLQLAYACRVPADRLHRWYAPVR
jgi:rSAM/selenodomain-associated transferase 2